MEDQTTLTFPSVQDTHEHHPTPGTWQQEIGTLVQAGFLAWEMVSSTYSVHSCSLPAAAPEFQILPKS